MRSAPYPGKDAKAAAKAQIIALGAAAQPDLDRCIEHGLPIGFQTTVSTALVHGTDKPATVSNATVDALGFFCWAMRDTIIARVEQELDAIADDAAAMSEKQREEALATINSDELEIHRRICALIWHTEMERGEIVDFAGNEPPMAVLGLRLVTAPRANPSPGTSPMHAYDIVGGRR